MARTRVKSWAKAQKPATRKHKWLMTGLTQAPAGKQDVHYKGTQP